MLPTTHLPSACHLPYIGLQIPDDEEAELTQEEMEALEEDMQSDFEVAEMIK